MLGAADDGLPVQALRRRQRQVEDPGRHAAVAHAREGQAGPGVAPWPLAAVLQVVADRSVDRTLWITNGSL